MTVAKRILDFYDSLESPQNLPPEVETMNPYQEESALKLATSFYKKFYGDNQPRTILFGINPGRFGGGITGVPFTDPIRLEKDCGIANYLDKRQELSSVFMYEMIQAFGGAQTFYNQFYFSAVSPLGYVKNGKNLNYYDIPNYKLLFNDYALKCIQQQFNLPIKKSMAFCIGQGQNHKFLTELNKKYHLFGRIEVVPHPRWVMQYKLKSKQLYINEYLQKLTRN